MQDIEQIYTKYAVQVYKYLFSLCHDPHTAEELTQETFFRAMKSIDSFRGDCRLYVWLCQIAKNLWIKEVKQSQRTAVYEPEKEIPSDAMQPDEELIARDERLYLYKRLHQLPEPVREVMYLRISGDFSFREIGEILGRDENWARGTFYRGKQKIREENRHESVEPGFFEYR